MKDLETRLVDAGEEFRGILGRIPHQKWDSAPAPRRRAAVRTLAIAAVAVVLAIGLPALILTSRPGGTPVGSGEELPTTTTPLALAALGVSPLTDGSPYLLVGADGWTITRHTEQSYGAIPEWEPQVYRTVGSELGGPTFAVAIFGTDDSTGWSAGGGAEYFELPGRTVSITADNTFPAAYAGSAVFDDGTLVVANGFGMTRDGFVDAVKGVTLDAGGELSVIAPPGFERLPLPPHYTGAVRLIETTYLGPNGGRAEVRVWSGSLADVESQVINRALEALEVRTTRIGDIPVVIAYEAPTRMFVVGGNERFVIEIDLNPIADDAASADIDALLTSLRGVDQVTFELALPAGSVTEADKDDVVLEMLADIPLPQDFDPSGLGSSGDRYQVGAQVISALVCHWIGQWVDAQASGDARESLAAIAAMATSRDWRILQEMQPQGGYSDVVWEYADAIAGDGTVLGGRVLTVAESYEDALGCRSQP